jgi:hypothetical protein
MREIPDHINITETATPSNQELDMVVFDEKFDEEESSDDDLALPRVNNRHTTEQDSFSDEKSDDDDDDEEEHFNPNRLPKKTGNLNASNLIGKKKESGKGARNDRRQQLSQSDSDEKDELAHI